jgi:UMF1 family MFS transporter
LLALRKGLSVSFESRKISRKIKQEDPISMAQLTHHHSNKRGILAWCIFDWGNAAFPTIVVTFIFAAYFTERVAQDNITGLQQWGNTIAIASFAIALLSPIFGAIADHHGRRKPWLGLCVIITIVASFALWFTKPDPLYTHWILGCVLVGYLGFSIGNVFYNSMLSDLAPPNYVGRISGWGWGLGYVGGLFCLGIALVVLIKYGAAWFQLDPETQEPVRMCGPLVALWLGIFSLPLFLLTPDRPRTNNSLTEAARKGMIMLGRTFKTLPGHKNILYFLIANMLYMDGLNTIFVFGSIYAAGTFHFTLDQIVLMGIVMNIAAAFGAAVFAWMDDFIGAKVTILTALLIMLVTTAGLVIAQSTRTFWALAIILSCAVGPVQAASRSLMVRLSPRHMSTEMFGLLALSGRATSFLGTALAAFSAVHFGNQRFGIAVVLIFLILGSLILFLVREPARSTSA